MLELIAAGGNLYYFAKFAGIFGLRMQDVGAQQTGVTVDEFKAKLVAARGATAMANIVGGIATPHIPAIGAAIAGDQIEYAYWTPFFDGYPPVHASLEKVNPDEAILGYNDHGLNFILDKMPSFGVGAASIYRTVDEGWGLKRVRPFPGHPALSWRLIDSLVADERELTAVRRCVSTMGSRCQCPYSGRAWMNGQCVPFQSQCTRCSTRCRHRRAASDSDRLLVERLHAFRRTCV